VAYIGRGGRRRVTRCGGIEKRLVQSEAERARESWERLRW
jgi:hypothetical protein